MRSVLSALAALVTVALILFTPFDRHAAAADFPMPDDVAITAPGGDVPPEWAAFSGEWKGKWDNKAPIKYVVERIYADGTAVIVYSWASYAPWNWKGGHERNVGTFEGDTLVFKNRHGTYTQSMVKAGKMRSEFVGEGRSAGVKGTSILKVQK